MAMVFGTIDRFGMGETQAEEEGRKRTDGKGGGLSRRTEKEINLGSHSTVH